jgi:predicted nucleic acid-binding protein
VKVLLDTNILIAAFVARGVCHELLEHCVRQHTVITF